MSNPSSGRERLQTSFSERAAKQKGFSKEQIDQMVVELEWHWENKKEGAAVDAKSR